MAVDRAGRVGIGAHSFRLFWPAIFVMAGGWAAAQEPARDQGKSIEGFGEARRGDVPEGTLEMMTPKTDEAIQNGLAWLARTQSADGSFGSSTYRGNIAVTSLAGLAFMSSGSSPGRGLYGRRLTRPWFM